MASKAKKKPKASVETVDVIAQIAERGLTREIAEACGITRQAVQQWLEVPANRVLAVARITRIPRYLIRPDIYPRRGGNYPAQKLSSAACRNSQASERQRQEK